MITARSQYDERPKLVSDLSFEGDQGVTKQSDLKDCDINLIMKRFERTGVLPDMIVRDGRYGDFSSVPDYQEACEIVRMANEQFAMLDVSIRNRFANDPAKFLEFVSDEKNKPEMAKMGLLTPEATKAHYEAELEKAKADRKAAEEAAKKDAPAAPAA